METNVENVWGNDYDASLGGVYMNVGSYTITTGNNYTKEVVPDNSSLSDNRKSLQLSGTINAMFLGESYQERYDALKRLEGSDDTSNLLIRSGSLIGKNEMVDNCGITKIVKKKTGNVDCIYCTISIIQIKKSRISSTKTKYTVVESPVQSKKKNSENVKPVITDADMASLDGIAGAGTVGR